MRNVRRNSFKNIRTLFYDKIKRYWIGNDHDLYSVIELASDVNIYSADRSNPDGAMFVISMDFKIGGV